MKPLNASETSCNPISSNCVIWQGPDLKCINLCKGDTITDVIEKEAIEICAILDILNIDAYQLDCFNLVACPPKTFEELIQFLINQICELKNITPPPASTVNGCPDCVVDIDTCFQYVNGLGDTVTSMQLTDYVHAIGKKVCALADFTGYTQTTLNSYGSRIARTEEQIVVLENEPVVLPTVTPTCVLPSVPTEMDLVLTALELQFCLLRNATGDPTSILTNIGRQCTGLNTQNRLSGSGTMSTITGWYPNVNTLDQSLSNIWLTICDMRSAIATLQLNAPTLCDSIIVNLVTTISGNVLTLFFTGTIPPAFSQCTGSTPLLITDGSGVQTTTVNLSTIINNPTGFAILLSPAINPGLTLTTTATVCMYDASTNTSCSSIVSHVLVNAAPCPILVPGLSTDTSIEFSYVSNVGNYQYTAQLYDVSGTILLQTTTSTISGASPQTVTFAGLTPLTDYTVRLSIIAAGCVTCLPTICNPFTEISTLAAPCAPAGIVTAVIVP